MFNTKSPPAAAFRAVILGASISLVLIWGTALAASGARSVVPQTADHPKAGKAESFATRAPLRGATTFQSMPGPPPIVNVPICTAIFDQFGPQMVPDGAGGSILVWQDYRSGQLDIYAQRVNGAGVPQWAPNGVPVCKAAGFQWYPRAVPDGAGGAIVVWQDGRAGTEFDVYVQRVGSSGTALWPNGGVAVCAAANDQTLPTVVSDGQGGAVIAWSDQRGADADIYAQRINTNGAVQWAANGVALCTATGAQQSLTIASDGLSGGIVGWQDLRAGDTNPDLYARRINESGTLQWAADGEAVCTAVNAQAAPALIGDGAGGVIVSWEDHRGADADVYAQRFNGNGVPQWALDGVALGAASGDQQAVALCPDGAGGALMAWEDRRGGSADIYAQRVSDAGAPQWAPNGVTVCSAPTDQVTPAIAFDVIGGAVVAWSDARDAGNGLDIYVQHIQTDGSALWTADGILLCNSPNAQDLPSAISDGLGGAAVAWRDFRSGSYSDVFCQRVSAAGQVPDQCVPPDTLAQNSHISTISPQNYRTFRQTYFYWGGMGVRSSVGSDWDVEVYDRGSVGLAPYPTCFGNPLAGSFERSGVDFVICDFTDYQTPPGVYGARVYSYSGTGSAVFEWDGGPGLIPKADNANPNNGVSASNWTGVLDVWDVDLTAGVTYTFEFNNQTPQTDMRLYVFSSAGAPGYHVVPRTARVLETSSRWAFFTAPSTEPYGVVVTNENGEAGSYELKVWSATPIGVGDGPETPITGIRGLTPNPSRGRVQIQFAMREAGVASFEIFDMAGRMVAGIPGRRWDPGAWSVEWEGEGSNGSRMSAGIYFVQMKVNSQRVGLGRLALLR